MTSLSLFVAVELFSGLFCKSPVDLILMSRVHERYGLEMAAKLQVEYQRVDECFGTMKEFPGYVVEHGPTIRGPNGFAQIVGIAPTPTDKPLLWGIMEARDRDV